MKKFKWADMGLIVGGRIAQAVLALLALRIMTSLLSVEEMGRWSLLIAAITFFTLGFVSPCGMFINRRLHSWVDRGTIAKYMKYYVAYLLLVATLASMILLLISLLYEIVPGMHMGWIVALACSTIVFSTLNQTFIPSFNLLGYRGWYVLLALLTVLAGLIISTGLVSWVSAKAELWQSGQIIGQLILALVASMIFFQTISKGGRGEASGFETSITREKINKLFLFAWPLALAVTFTWVQSQSYRFVAQEMIGLEALGLFVVGYGVSASLIGMFESIISTYFLPRFYKRTSSENHEEQASAWTEYASIMFSCLFLGIAIIISISSELTLILLDEKFAAAAQFIAWGAAAEASRVAVGTYALIAHSKMDTKKLIIPNLIGALVAPLFVFLFAREWGALGVGVGLALAGVVVVVTMKIVLSSSFAFVTPWKDLLQSALIAVTMVVLAILFHLFFGRGDSFLSALSWVLCAGIVLLSALYYILSPHIGKRLSN